MLFLDTGCAELLSGSDGWDQALRPCSLPLEIVRRDVHESTDGPIDHLHVQCPRGHRYLHVLPMASPRPPVTSTGTSAPRR